MILRSNSGERAMTMERRTGYDVWLLALTLALCVIGAMFVLTSSAVHSWRLHHGDSTAIFLHHLARAGWGLACMAGMVFVDYRSLARVARALWLFALAWLIAVLFLPQPAGATAHRWVYAGGASFQPAEFAKFALIVYLAMRFGALRDDPFTYSRSRVYRGALIVSLLTFALILLEPNLSMAVIVAGVAGLLFYLSGIRLRPIAVIGGAMALPVACVVWLTPYMHQRVVSFVDGIVDPARSSYHVKQSLIGIGQGGLAGLGLGNSMQKHFFLPEPHKDFIFSIVAEETGLIGATLLLVMFTLFLTRAWRIARRAPDSFGYYLGAGITLSIGLSFLVNVGVALGLLPATGQPLPFVSYGGSSLMMTLAAVGVLLNISRQIQRAESRTEPPAMLL